MFLPNNTSIDMHHDSGGEDSKDFEIDPTVIERYIEAFGVMNTGTTDLKAKNRDKVIALLYVYPNKFDIDPAPHIQPKIEKLKKAGLTSSQVLDICASNIKVLSSREDKYWRKIELLIAYDMPSNLLYDMLMLSPSKKDLKEAIKGMVSIGN